MPCGPLLLVMYPSRTMHPEVDISTELFICESSSKEVSWIVTGRTIFP